MGLQADTARLATDLIVSDEHWIQGDWCQAKPNGSLRPTRAAYGSTDAWLFCLEGAIGHASALVLGLVEDAEKGQEGGPAIFNELHNLTGTQREIATLAHKVLSAVDEIAWQRFGWPGQDVNDNNDPSDGGDEPWSDRDALWAKDAAVRAAHLNAVWLLEQTTKALDEKGL